MQKANDWQRHIDYKSRLNAEDRAWLEQWTREEYDCNYDRKILSPAQATEARNNKARQARDVLNQAIYGLEKFLIERLPMSEESAKKPKKEKKVLDPLELAERRVKANKRTGKEATKEQLELSFTAYSTAVLCMEAVKPGDENTRNNIQMAKTLFAKISYEVLDEYTVRFGIRAGQELMGLYAEEKKLTVEEAIAATGALTPAPETPTTEGEA